MGRAIVRQPAAFLLDEPLSNLDARLRVQMRTELARLQRKLGTTMVYVTHDQTEAMTLGDRIAVLRKGEIQQVGTPRELYRRPANLFVAGFIGSPAMNLLPARVEGDQLLLPMTQIPLPAGFRACPPDGMRQVIAGIRPEHFRDPSATDGDEEDVGGFDAPVQLVEWLGSDLFVHFDAQVEDSGHLGALQREMGLDAVDGDRLRLVARIGADSRASEGESVRLQVHPDAVLLFDPHTGERIDAAEKPR
jgi:multiple sugar transport system ATP-binding protein